MIPSFIAKKAEACRWRGKGLAPAHLARGIWGRSWWVGDHISHRCPELVPLGSAVTAQVGVTPGFEVDVLEPLKPLSHENNYLSSVDCLPLEIHSARVLSQSPCRKAIWVSLGRMGRNALGCKLQDEV